MDVTRRTFLKAISLIAASVALPIDSVARVFQERIAKLNTSKIIWEAGDHWGTVSSWFIIEKTGPPIWIGEFTTPKDVWDQDRLNVIFHDAYFKDFGMSKDIFKAYLKEIYIGLMDPDQKEISGAGYERQPMDWKEIDIDFEGD